MINENGGKRERERQTGKEEQISAIANPTNQVKNETTTHPQTRLAGPAYNRLEPYSGAIPVKSVMVENDMAKVLNKVCNNKVIIFKHNQLQNTQKNRKKQKHKNENENTISLLSSCL